MLTPPPTMCAEGKEGRGGGRGEQRLARARALALLVCVWWSRTSCALLVQDVDEGDDAEGSASEEEVMPTKTSRRRGESAADDKQEEADAACSQVRGLPPHNSGQARHPGVVGACLPVATWIPCSSDACSLRVLPRCPRTSCARGGLGTRHALA